MYKCREHIDSAINEFAVCVRCGSRDNVVWVDEFRNVLPRSIVRQPKKLSDIPARLPSRIPGGLDSFNAVLGGGYVPGTVILLYAEPGTGKSTVALQEAARLAVLEIPALYLNLEEESAQLSARSIALDLPSRDFFLYPESNLDRVADVIRNSKPRVVFVDSLAKVFNPDVPEARAGGPLQLSTSAQRLVKIARREQCVIVLLGHVGKDGDVSGPGVLEHDVDVVIEMGVIEGSESQLIENGTHFLRVTKNRYGPAPLTSGLVRRENGFRSHTG